MSGRSRVAVTRRLPAAVEEQLAREFDAQLNRDDRPLEAAGLQQALRTADGLLCTVTDRISAEVLAVEPLQARILANFGVGFNHIDLAAARTRGVVVTNTPEVLTEDTADDAFMLMLMVARRAGEGERQVRAGAWTGWRPTHLLGTKVSGKTLGLVGMGRIARAVARRARLGFGMRVLFHDPVPPPPEVVGELGATARPSVDDVVRVADMSPWKNAEKSPSSGGAHSPVFVTVITPSDPSMRADASTGAVPCRMAFDRSSKAVRSTKRWGTPGQGS